LCDVPDDKPLDKDVLAADPPKEPVKAWP